MTKTELKNTITNIISISYHNDILYSERDLKIALLDNIDYFLEPFEKWINEDGELDSIIEIINKTISLG